jgi:hypothetical protein
MQRSCLWISIVVLCALMLMAPSTANAIRIAASSCGACNTSVCNSEPCPTADQYYCTSGSSEGGCATSASAWNNSLICTSCCDLSTCPPPPTPPASCPPCNASTCALEPCTKTDPYYCTRGNSAGGCAPSKDSWNNPKLCTACCDLSHCPTPRPPPVPTPAPTIRCHKTCSRETCDKHPCTKAEPYVCEKGKSAGGCAAHASYWNNSLMCDECCDVNTCPTRPPSPPLKCGRCSSAECAKKPCSKADPYVCTKGKSAGGCAPNSTSWSNAALCDACCDINSCPNPPPPSPPSPPPCPSCNQTMCANAMCPVSSPYYCESGTAAGGCAASRSMWSSNVCSACCDASSC